MRVVLDNRDLIHGLAKMRRKGPPAWRRAVKRAETAAKAVMSKEIKADTGLPAARIKREIHTDRIGEYGVALRVEGDRIPLIDFSAKGPEPSRGRGRGVSYKLGSGRKRIGDAFIATMNSGHRGVFRRVTKARTPIVELFGPSMVKVFGKYLSAGAKRADEVLRSTLSHEIARFAGGK